MSSEAAIVIAGMLPIQIVVEEAKSTFAEKVLGLSMAEFRVRERA